MYLNFPSKKFHFNGKNSNTFYNKNIDFWHENTIFGFVLNVGNKIVFTIQFYVHGSWIIT